MSRTGPTWQPPDLVVRNKFRWALFAVPIVVSSFVWSALSFNESAPAVLRLAFGLAAVGPLLGHGLNWRNGIAVGESGVEVRTDLLRRQRRTWAQVESFELRTDRGRWRIVVLLVDEPPLTTTGAAVLNPDGRWGTRMVRRLEAFRLTATESATSAQLPLCSLDNVAGFGHYAPVSALRDDFARRHPNDAVWVDSEWFVSAERVVELLGEAQALGVGVLGLEGFLIDEGATYPALGRIADFSYDTPEKAAQQAGELLAGSWADAPTPSDQMNSRATGRHMVAVVLDD